MTMFHRIQHYELIEAAGQWYRPRAYGDPRSDGTWDGWLVFFPKPQGTAIAPPSPETTQTNLDALAVWAAGLRPVYLEGALARALAVAQEPALISRLAAAEYRALDDAQQLETSAAVERNAADADEAAASIARADAERLRQERLVTEEALAATDEAAATLEADIYEHAARDARAAASDAAQQRRAAHRQQTRQPPQKPGGKNKKK